MHDNIDSDRYISRAPYASAPSAPSIFPQDCRLHLSRALIDETLNTVDPIRFRDPPQTMINAKARHLAESF